ncbi:MAG: hypothetical protein OEQ13_12595, partial [Acidobacteriota bacterium]|nr:hypothetical protein [Acidobacteriota bacterium]
MFDFSAIRSSLRAGVVIGCMAACMDLAVSDGTPPGIWTHEDEWEPSVDIGVLSSARVEPLCVRHGVDTFALSLGLVDPANVVEVRVHVYLFTQNGVPTNPILLFDDGLDDDAVAGDGIFTASALEFASAPDPVGKTGLRFWDIDLVFADMTVQTVNEDLALTILYIQPSIPLPQVDTLAPDVVASPHVVSISSPLSGSFPSNSVSVTTIANRYYDFFPDDRDFLLVARMFNTGGAPAASFGVVNNDVQGIGLSVFDSSAAYGSAGVLQGVMNIYWGNGTSILMNHELLHRWAAYLDFSLDLAASGSHWETIERPSSGFGGPPPYAGFHHHLKRAAQQWRGWYDDNVSDYDYSDLELYLMGLIGYDDLASPIPTLIDSTWDRYETLQGITYSYYFAAGMRDVPKSEIVGVEGSRVPDVSSAQTSFQSGLVVVYDRVLTAVELAYWEYALSEYKQPSSTIHEWTFQQATGDRAQLDTYMPLLAGATPDGGPVPGAPLIVTSAANPDDV